MTREEIIQNKTDLQGANLQGADLQKANLCVADFQGANLRGANFCGSNLRKADLRGANLRGAKLQEANLQKANLCGADLWGADLLRADLRIANLWEANLQRANLQRSDLRGAKLQEANLQGSDLRGANLDTLKYDYLTIGIHPPLRGNLIVYKKVHCTSLRHDVVIELFVSAATPRTCATTRKYRSWGAIPGNDTPAGCYTNFNGIRTEYLPGVPVMPDSFDLDRWIECGHGIHWFLTYEEAERNAAWKLY